MNNKNLKRVGILSTSLSIIVAIFTLLFYAVGQIDSGTFLFTLWTISPYVCLLVIYLLLEKLPQIPKISVVFCVVSVLMLGFTLLAYVGTLGNESSAYGFIFLFFPFYLLVGGAILFGGGLIWALLSKPPNDKSS